MNICYDLVTLMSLQIQKTLIFETQIKMIFNETSMFIIRDAIYVKFWFLGIPMEGEKPFLKKDPNYLKSYRLLSLAYSDTKYYIPGSHT